jgi:2',3'-cyclic-nucleotide 2'-phosphodiesterase
MKFLFIGDIVGKPGRRAVTRVLPELRKKEGIDFVIANAENATHGRGAKVKHLRELREAGVDFFTSGDHIFHIDKEEPFSDPEIDIIRPANFPEGTPGVGFKTVLVSGKRVAVVNLMGITFLGDKFSEDTRYSWLESGVENPFRRAEEILAELEKEQPDLIFVDFHCEVTSEKRAMGFFLDGKATAVLGTHTHVPTADASVLPEGTGYVSDIGMTGAENSVLGVEPRLIIDRLKDGAADPFRWVEDGPAVFASVIVETDSAGLVKMIRRIDEQNLSHL